MTTDDESLLSELVGAKVESVVFVMDYLQLTMWLPQSSPTLTCFAWPTISAPDGVTCSYGDSGFRDGLCALITSEVVAAESSTGAGLVLHFSAGEVVALRPTKAELEEAEVAILRMNDDAGIWMVWRPGEAPYKANT